MKKGILIKRRSDGKKLEIKLVDIHSNESISELHQIYELLDVSLIDVRFHLFSLLLQTIDDNHLTMKKYYM